MVLGRQSPAQKTMSQLRNHQRNTMGICRKSFVLDVLDLLFLSFVNSFASINDGRE